ncbi:hypothetical protein Salat_1886100 [Sesamum alatum]|uniref:SANTA domain-containing protein n=1 Tax=Sesamum alatum TaxID=300844 RepID=A0AAE2CI73_9LAMI|nr:hypothetical protein Salat_1886100 [Sesamum alatum]
MASASTPVHQKDKGKTPTSHFHPTVCLADWWLVKAEDDFQGSRLAVAGFTSRKKQAMRVFSSAPILKTHGVSILETTDGICVILQHPMNEVRTLENGFPSDVCDHFLFGFPLFWKEYEEYFLDNIDMTCNASGPLQEESYSALCIVEDHIASDIPLTCVKNTMHSATDSFSGGNVKISAVIDKNDDSQSPDNVGILSACHLYNRSRSKLAADNLRKVEVHRKDPTNANSGKSMNLSHEILSHTEGRVATRSMSNLKMKEKNNKVSATMSGGEKISLNSVLSMGSEKLDLASGYCEPGGRNNCYLEVRGFHRSTDKVKLGKLGAGSMKDVLEQISETSSQDKDLRKNKTKGKTQKAKYKATMSPSMPAAADNQKDNVIAEKNHLSEMTNSSRMITRRKLRTPDKEKEKVPTASPHSSSFKRSRSGRLLMPTLAFWCNQRAIYDADRTVTGIVDGIDLEQPRNGSWSTPQKRRQLM